MVGAVKGNALGFHRIPGNALGITRINSKTNYTQMPLPPPPLSVAVNHHKLAPLFASTLTRNLYR
ncbi:MAG: hypothetical protein WKF36_01160 [Candidatus Nitrosocosmicus sp.]